ncbi:MAG: hypothetical protein V9G12_10760 [Microthrixaceae bacterium]
MNHVRHHTDDHLAHVRRITGTLDGCIERAGDSRPGVRDREHCPLLVPRQQH